MASQELENQAFLTKELIKQIVSSEVISLKQEIETLKSELQTDVNKVEDFKIEEVYNSIKCEESYEIIKSFPEFKGELEKYVSWREAAVNAMSQYIRKRKRYFAALSILRNKITGKANYALTIYETVLNVDAILDRLDFVFSDRRPLHIIEQELSILTQGNLRGYSSLEALVSSLF